MLDCHKAHELPAPITKMMREMLQKAFVATKRHKEKFLEVNFFMNKDHSGVTYSCKNFFF